MGWLPKAAVQGQEAKVTMDLRNVELLLSSGRMGDRPNRIHRLQLTPVCVRRSARTLTSVQRTGTVA